MCVYFVVNRPNYHLGFFVCLDSGFHDGENIGVIQIVAGDIPKGGGLFVFAFEKFAEYFGIRTTCVEGHEAVGVIGGMVTHAGQLAFAEVFQVLKGDSTRLGPISSPDS